MQANVHQLTNLNTKQKLVIECHCVCYWHIMQTFALEYIFIMLSVVIATRHCNCTIMLLATFDIVYEQLKLALCILVQF